MTSYEPAGNPPIDHVPSATEFVPASQLRPFGPGRAAITHSPGTAAPFAVTVPASVAPGASVASTPVRTGASAIVSTRGSAVSLVGWPLQYCDAHADGEPDAPNCTR